MGSTPDLKDVDGSPLEKPGRERRRAGGWQDWAEEKLYVQKVERQRYVNFPKAK